MATPFLLRHQKIEKNVLRSFLPLLKGNSLPEELFLLGRLYIKGVAAQTTLTQLTHAHANNMREQMARI